MVNSHYTRVALIVALAGGVGLGADRYLPTFRGERNESTSVPVDVRADLSAHLNRIEDTRHVPEPEYALLSDFYGGAAPAALWIDGRGDMTTAAEQTLDLLRTADRDGLNPADYLSSDALTANGTSSAAEFEVELTRAALRYLRDLHHGRVSVDTGSRVWPSGPRAEDAELLARMRLAASTTGIPQLASEVAPQAAEYGRLRAALADYRVRASRVQLPPLPDLMASIHPGEDLVWAELLRAHLAVHGDMDDNTALTAPLVYEEVLVEGVRRFQRRHGLNDDGVIGRGTMQALQVPLSQRVRQLELALERMRWLPSELDGPAVVVDIPMFRLTALNQVRAAGAPALTMRVAVGGSVRHRTPQLVSRVGRVVFRPAWNVPRSITTREILPKLKDDADYLSRNGYELVPVRRSDAPEDVDVMAGIAEGAYRLRQQPGGGNSLGLVKFDFQNDHAVYLHDTPAKAAFARDRRDVSHGCVRVDDPVALARWLLAVEGWSEEQVRAAMAGADLQSVSVPQSVAVVLRYTTASVDPDGTVRFGTDIYKLDEVLEKALRSS
jgi:murein L,D-transpeptidase YcbB/YkuD